MFFYTTCSAVQVLERDEIMKKYQAVAAHLEQDLSGVSIDKLDISDEVKEQVRLIISLQKIFKYSFLFKL